MASTVKHLRSSTANKRPTASGLADGQLGINTASGTPGVFFKDSAGTVTKVGPAHVGSTAPNVSPAGSAGNSLGELWVNNSTTINGLNYYTGSAFVNLTPSGTTTVAGLVELATNAETQTGTDTVRAVTPSGLQSKISNSTSTASSTTIASATAVKAAYDLADAALPKSGGRVTGALEIGPVGSLVFEGSSDDSFETTLAVVNPTADRTITFPNVTGTVITAGDTGTVTSTMILDGTIVNADINASAAIALSKLATGALPTGITIASGNIIDGTIANADINASAGIVYSKLALSSGIVNADISASAAIALSKLATGALPTGITVSSGNIVDGTIINADISASAAIDGTKISPNFGSQDITIGDKIIHNGDTNTAIRFPAADTIAFETDGSERARIDGSGRVLVGTTASGAFVNISANTTEDALRVTQTGTGNALVVEDSANPDGSPFVVDANGRVTQGHTTALSLNGSGGIPSQQLNTATSTLFAAACYSAVNWGNNTAAPGFFLAKARADAVGTYTIVPNNQILGQIRFAGADGVQFQNAGSIGVEVDGTTASGVMPGRIVFATVLSGTTTSSEVLRLTNDNVIAYSQTAPETVNTTATLTVAQLKNGLITSAPASGVTMTLPTGTDTQSGFNGIYTGMAFQWSVINTGPNTVTISGATGHTVIGSSAVASGVSGRFTSRRSANNTFVSYRLS
jgi:hypothetical protein